MTKPTERDDFPCCSTDATGRTDHEIPEDAIEAATRRLAAENGWEGPYPRGLARAALEAAAPYMRGTK